MYQITYSWCTPCNNGRYIPCIIYPEIDIQSILLGVQMYFIASARTISYITELSGSEGSGSLFRGCDTFDDYIRYIHATSRKAESYFKHPAPPQPSPDLDPTALPESESESAGRSSTCPGGQQSPPGRAVTVRRPPLALFSQATAG